MGSRAVKKWREADAIMNQMAFMMDTGRKKPAFPEEDEFEKLAAEVCEMVCGRPRKFPWPFGDWDYDSLIYGDFPLHELPKTVLLRVARHLDNDGRRAMSQTCSKFWNLLVDNKTIDRRVVEKDNFVLIFDHSVAFSRPRKEFYDLESFRQFMEKLPLYRITERVWIIKKCASIPFCSPRDLMATMEGYCNVFGLRKAFTSGWNVQSYINNFRELQNVKALIVTDDTNLPPMQHFLKYCRQRGIFVPPRTYAFRFSIDPVGKNLQPRPEEIPSVFTDRYSYL